MERPNFYGIIPASVRYCTGLMPNAKLLYCEITALANERGYCWASNQYFAEVLSVDATTVSRWISALRKYGFIKVVINKAAGNQRHIYTNEGATLLTKKSIGISKKINTYTQKSQDPIDEKVKRNSKRRSSKTDYVVRTYGEKNAEPDPAKKAPPVAAVPPKLFSESEWYCAPGDDGREAAIERFRARVISLVPETEGADFLHYYQRAEKWSQTKSAKAENWPEQVAKWIVADAGRAARNNNQPKPSSNGNDRSKLDKTRIFDRAARIAERIGG